jgi:hypothetical protein
LSAPWLALPFRRVFVQFVLLSLLKLGGVEGEEGGTDGLGELAEGGGDDFHALALGGEEEGARGVANAVEVALAELGGGALGVDQAAGDDDDGGIEGHGEVGHVDAEGAGLGIEDFEGEGVALLGTATEGERLVLGGVGRGGELVTGVFGKEGVEILGEAGDGGVGLDATPGAAAAAAEGGDLVQAVTEDLQGHGHVAGLHAGELVAGEGEALGVDVGGTEAGAGGEEEDGGLGVAAHAGGFADAAEVAVVADGEGDGAAGRLGEGGGVVGVKIPADEALGQVGGLGQHAVALVGAGEGEADAAHLGPGEVVLGEEAQHALDPTGDDGGGAGLGVGGTLAELGGDGRAVGVDAAGLGGRGTGIGAEVDVAGGGGHRGKREVACRLRLEA